MPITSWGTTWPIDKIKSKFPSTSHLFTCAGQEKSSLPSDCSRTNSAGPSPRVARSVRQSCVRNKVAGVWPNMVWISPPVMGPCVPMAGRTPARRWPKYRQANSVSSDGAAGRGGAEHGVDFAAGHGTVRPDGGEDPGQALPEVLPGEFRQFSGAGVVAGEVRRNCQDLAAFPERGEGAKQRVSNVFGGEDRGFGPKAG